MIPVHIPPPAPARPRSVAPAPRRASLRHLGVWLFMRVSGVLLLFLVLAHLTVNLVVGDGINAIDFALVAGRWSNPFWQLWSLVMLWLAMLHGAHGLVTVIDDYAETVRVRLLLKVLVTVTTAVTVTLGTLVIYTFDPCPVGADPAHLPSFCTA